MGCTVLCIQCNQLAPYSSCITRCVFILYESYCHACYQHKSELSTNVISTWTLVLENPNDAHTNVLHEHQMSPVARTKIFAESEAFFLI